MKIVAARFNGFTVGAGIGVGPLLLDVAYLRESGEYVDPSLFPQTVTTQRFLVSIIYRHRPPVGGARLAGALVLPRPRARPRRRGRGPRALAP